MAGAGGAMAALFQRSLRDMIAGIRAHPGGEAAHVENEVVPGVRKEAKSPDPRIKAVAVQKAAYLHMLGFDADWAAFPAVEAMSATRLQFKSAGYSAAAATFHPGTDVMLLIPNLLKKDLLGNSALEACLALDCLANIATPELAQALVADVFGLLQSSKPIVRRRAALCLLRLLQQFPDGLRPCFKGLAGVLDDPDAGARAAAVGVLCELAMQHPQNYLQIAPVFYRLLTSGQQSNWTTIKILKIFRALAPLEPRLGKKLRGPVAQLLRDSPAKSVTYECIMVAISGMAGQEDVLALALQELKGFLVDTDANIRYLGLQMVQTVFDKLPGRAAEFKETIMPCLDVADTSIQRLAFCLLSRIVDEASLPGTVATMLEKVAGAGDGLRDEVVELIIKMCCSNRYGLVTNFAWYLSVLRDLVQVTVRHGDTIAEQIADVAIRVDAVRGEAVNVSLHLLTEPAYLAHAATHGGSTLHHVLHTAAWVVGENAGLAADPVRVLEALLQPGAAGLPRDAQAAYVHAVTMQLVHALAGPGAAAGEGQAGPQVLIELVEANLGIFLKSPHLAVQQRARELAELVRVWKEGVAKPGDAGAFFRAMAGALASPLAPVSSKSQGRVAAPPGLDLGAPLAAPGSDPASASASNLSRSSSQSSLSAFPGADAPAGDAADAAAVLTARSAAEMKRSSSEYSKQLHGHREKFDMFYLGAEKLPGARGGGKAEVEGGGGGTVGLVEESLRFSAVAGPPAGAGGGAGAGTGAGAARAEVKFADDEGDEDESVGEKVRDAMDVDVLAPLEDFEALPQAASYPTQAPAAGLGPEEAGPFAGAPGAERGRKHRKEKKERKEKKHRKEKKERSSRGERPRSDGAAAEAP